MSYIILPHRWHRQPQFVPGVERYVASCAVPASAKLLNVAGGAWTEFGTSLSASITPIGRAVRTNNTYWYRTNPIQSGPLTVGIVFVPTSATGQYGIWSVGSTSGDGSPQILLQRNGADIQVYCSGGYQTVFSGVVVVGNPLVMALSFDKVESTGSLMRVAVNGVVKEYAGGWRNTAETTEYFGTGYQTTSNGDYVLYWNEARQNTVAELTAKTLNPWQIFAPIQRRIWVPVSAGGTITIDCGIGNAVAAGVSFIPQSSLPTSAGNAVAAGVSTILADTLQTVVGNAVAAGTSFLPQESLPTTLGNAVAAGTTADITLDSGITIACTVGNAVANGVATTFAVNLATSVGDAAAAGVTATFEVSIPASIGNAVADGVQAAIELSHIIGTAIGNAVATGITADITLQAGTIARPSSDVAVNCWLPSTGGDLYAMLDEATADDADYIYANSACACTVGLSSVADPGTSSGQVLSYRAWSPSGNGLVVRLKEGTTTIATWTHATLPLTVTQYDRSLSAAECDAITNYSNLRVEFEST